MIAFLLLAFSMFPTSLRRDPPGVTALKVHKIAVGGEGGWEYLTVDSDTRRLTSRGEIGSSCSTLTRKRLWANWRTRPVSTGSPLSPSSARVHQQWQR